MQVGGSAAGAGALRQGLLDVADADADVPGVLAQQPLGHEGQGSGVVEHALELVTRGPLEPAEHPDVGQGGQGGGDPVGRGGLGGAALVDGEDRGAHGPTSFPELQTTT
jgi:hypothetical protein